MVRALDPLGQDRADRVGLPALAPDPHAVEVTPAVSVLMVRDGAQGLEFFAQHRVHTMDFAAGVIVFPGGRIDPGDEALGADLEVAPGLVEGHRKAWRDTDYQGLPGGVRTLLACGMREVKEETGVGLQPADMKPWANWITPLGPIRRFNVFFFVAPVADGVDPIHCTTEASNSEWLPVKAVLDDEQRHRVKLMRPTLTLLGGVDSLGSVGRIVASTPTIRPVVG